VRAEDKELEGPELERAGLEVAEVAEVAKDDELPVFAGEAFQDLELAHRGRLFDALTLILGREQLDISLLYLPQRETNALEFLQTAVTGRDGMGEFVYAENRSVMLEQALAVLQQNLTHGSGEELAKLHAKFASLTSEIAELREQLHDLEEAQDDVERPPVFTKTVEATDDDEAKPAPEEPDESLTGFIASALQALADVSKTESTLAGPELAEPPKRPSSLVDGPEVPEPPRPPSTLGDDAPAAPVKPKGKKRG
jgi:hypothetical protein